MINQKIEYTIDNFSGIIKITDWENVYFHNKKLHWRHKDRKPIFLEKQISGVYILYNDNKEIIYIGKSGNIRNRLADHLFRDGGLKIMCDYEKEFFLNKRKESFYFSYIKVPEQFVDLVEIGLINKEQPKYNIEYNSNAILGAY